MTGRDEFMNKSANTEKNVFLKEYVEKKLEKENIKLPEGFEITVKSPTEISEEDRKLLRDVRVNTYKARVNDMFNLLKEDKLYVTDRVKEMGISDKEKSDLLDLKAKYDNYYTIELNTPDKSYDLINLTEEDKNELNEIFPAITIFATKEQKNLTEIKNYFSEKEIKKEVLADSGKTSRQGAYALVPVLTVLGAKAVWEQKSAAKEIRENPENYLNEQIRIFKEGNPMKAYLKKGGMKKFMNDMKGGASKKWLSVLAIAFASSWDDDLGSVKDFFQDRDNFGTKKALGIAIPSMIMGTLTSFVIAPIMDSMINFNRASAYVKKHAPEHIPAGNKKSKAALILGNALFGIAFSAFSSGSSWTSEALTFLKLKNNEKELKSKNILTDEEAKKTNTMKNFMSYEAYSGKLEGILGADPISGALFGGAGWLTSANPYVNSLTTTVCGCIETITASVKQFTKDGERKHSIDKDKEKLLQSV